MCYLDGMPINPNPENLAPANRSLLIDFFWAAIGLRSRYATFNRKPQLEPELYTTKFNREAVPRFISSRTPYSPFEASINYSLDITLNNEWKVLLPEVAYFVGNIAICQSFTAPDGVWYHWAVDYQVNSIKRSVVRTPTEMQLAVSGVVPDPALEFPFRFKAFSPRFATTEAWQLIDFFGQFPANSAKLQ